MNLINKSVESYKCSIETANTQHQTAQVVSDDVYSNRRKYTQDETRTGSRETNKSGSFGSRVSQHHNQSDGMRGGHDYFNRGYGMGENRSNYNRGSLSTRDRNAFDSDDFNRGNNTKGNRDSFNQRSKKNQDYRNENRGNADEDEIYADFSSHWRTRQRVRDKQQRKSSRFDEWD